MPNPINNNYNNNPSITPQTYTDSGTGVSQINSSSSGTGVKGEDYWNRYYGSNYVQSINAAIEEYDLDTESANSQLSTNTDELNFYTENLIYLEEIAEECNFEEKANEMQELIEISLNSGKNETYSIQLLEELMQKADFKYITLEDIQQIVEENNLENKTIEYVLSKILNIYKEEQKIIQAQINYNKNKITTIENIQEFEECESNSDFDEIVSSGKKDCQTSLTELLNYLSENFDSVVEDEGGVQYAKEEIITSINIIAEIYKNKSEIKEYLSTNAASNERYTDLILEYYKIVECMTEEQINIYTYLYETEGGEKAQEYLVALEDKLNDERGRLDAEAAMEVFKNEDDPIAAITIYFKGIDSGVSNNLIGLQNSLLADGTLTAEEYKVMYLTQMIMEEYPSTFETIFNAGNSAGNMIPMIMLSCINTIPAALEMYSSTYGNTYNQTIMNGYSEEYCKEYAQGIALIETIGDVITTNIFKLGSKIFPDITLKIINKLGIENNLLKYILGMVSDLAQEVGSENLQNILEGEWKEIILGEQYSITLEEIKETTLVSILLYFTMGGASNLMLDIITEQGTYKVTLTDDQIKNMIESGKYTTEDITTLLSEMIENGATLDIDMQASALATQLGIEQEVAKIMITENCTQEVAQIMYDYNKTFNNSNLNIEEIQTINSLLQNGESYVNETGNIEESKFIEIVNNAKEIIKTRNILSDTNIKNDINAIIDINNFLSNKNVSEIAKSKILELTAKYDPEPTALSNWLAEYNCALDRGWKQEDGWTYWPPDAGNFPGSKIENGTIETGTIIDRGAETDFKATGGRFVANSGGNDVESITAGFKSGELIDYRAMEPDKIMEYVVQYEVIETINNDQVSQAFVNADNQIKQECIDYMLLNLSAEEIKTRFSEELILELERVVNQPIDEILEELGDYERSYKERETYAKAITNLLLKDSQNFEFDVNTIDFSPSEGIAAPWFNEGGGSQQYEFIISCELLEKLGFLEKIGTSWN